MSYPINYPTPQGANVQIFSEGGTASDWVKPQGASFVWFTLIGGGGGGASAVVTGGSSSAVTNFMCPAFLIPDMLRVNVGAGGAVNNDGTNSTVIYQLKNGAGYTLLTGTRGINGAGGGGAAMIANNFTAMGFFQSIAGQTGSSGNPGASTTTFLSAGGGGAVTANYGYTTPVNNNGYFQMQPIIVGVGGGGGLGVGGIGCGGSYGKQGGDGIVVIITW